MKNKLLGKNNLFNYILIIIISIIVCIPLFNSNFDITRDDGIQHICRIMGTYQTMIAGENFLAIMSNFCNGFGYSWNIFYSPLTSILPLIFKIFTFSFTICLKLFMSTTIILSGIFMYKFVDSVTENRKMGLIAAIIYITVPYHLTDMYIRIAVSELTAFVFLPLVFLGLHNIFNGNIKKSYYLTIGSIGLILSHSISVYITVIFSFIYVLINIKKLKQKCVLKPLFINLTLIILVTSFFWIPMLEHMTSTQYEVFLPDRMATNQSLNNNKITVLQLIYTENGKIVFEIGLLILIGLIMTPFIIRKVNKQYLYMYFTFFLFGTLCLLLPLKELSIKLPTMLNILQFPWRLIGFAAFFLSTTTAINLGIILDRFSLKIIWVIILLSIICLIPAKKQIRYFENFNELDYYNGAILTTNTGRVHAGMATLEYLPIKAFQNKEYIVSRTQNVYIIKGSVNIYNENKKNSKMSFYIKDSIDKTEIELPYIYYLGYEVKLITQDSVEKIDVFESKNGFVAVQLPQVDNAKIEVLYSGTNLTKISYFLSFVGLVLLVCYIITNNKKHNVD